MEGIELAKKILMDNNYTCVAVQGKDVVLTSFERGVKPLIQLYETKKDSYESLYLADKVIGKAAAYLAVLCGITSIYTNVVSEEAKKVLRTYNIPVSYELEVPFIVNRRGDGKCPMEELSEGVNEPLEMYHRIKGWLAKMG
ncbi:MAG: DUF1893 domain-containing protein [Clostridiaceae bacterium]|nr:DUF1893 domain-containing protein [Clostridiaceae bacterium]